MVARRTPPNLNPLLIRETLNKVDRCMARLQELQYTATGGTKAVSGVNLSPRSTRAYLKTSLRCKQESVLRIKNGSTKKSPVGKFPPPPNTGEWRRMSLPAMLVGETIGEILQASQFAREIVSAVGGKTPSKEDPKTPMSQRSSKKINPENTQLKSRRKKEKQTKLQSDGSPSLQKAHSRRITFKVSPPKVRELDRENKNKYLSLANRVSPKNRPWVKKTVLFPNPLFLSTHASSSQSQQQQFCKTRSPVISRNRGTTTPHKFLIKSPPSNSKFQVQIKSTTTVSISPTRPANLSKNSPKRLAASKFRQSFSPSRLATRLVSSPTRPANLSKNSPKRLAASKFRQSFSPSRLATRLVSSPTRPANLSKNSPKRSAVSKFRRSFSPSRLANRLVSPLRSKKTAQKSDVFVSGLKQRPTNQQFNRA